MAAAIPPPGLAQRRHASGIVTTTPHTADIPVLPGPPEQVAEAYNPRFHSLKLDWFANGWGILAQAIWWMISLPFYGVCLLPFGCLGWLMFKFLHIFGYEYEFDAGGWVLAPYIKFFFMRPFPIATFLAGFVYGVVIISSGELWDSLSDNDEWPFLFICMSIFLIGLILALFIFSFALPCIQPWTILGRNEMRQNLTTLKTLCADFVFGTGPGTTVNPAHPKHKHAAYFLLALIIVSVIGIAILSQYNLNTPRTTIESTDAVDPPPGTHPLDVIPYMTVWTNPNTTDPERPSPVDYIFIRSLQSQVYSGTTTFMDTQLSPMQRHNLRIVQILEAPGLLTRFYDFDYLHPTLPLFLHQSGILDMIRFNSSDVDANLLSADEKAAYQRYERMYKNQLNPPNTCHCNMSAYVFQSDSIGRVFPGFTCASNTNITALDPNSNQIQYTCGGVVYNATMRNSQNSLFAEMQILMQEQMQPLDYVRKEYPPWYSAIALAVAIAQPFFFAAIIAARIMYFTEGMNQPDGVQLQHHQPHQHAPLVPPVQDPSQPNQPLIQHQHYQNLK